jgi:2-succinyl-6-hydroxy-2,4-cyclohexadiene-1-carboxylate synthase
MIIVLIPTNGIRLHVESYEQRGEPVIFLHFGTGHLGMWRHVLPWFVPDYSVVTADLRGHGDSDKPAGGYTLSNMAADIVGVMDFLGIERAHFVGSSMGAEVSLRLAAEHPERVTDLVLEEAFQNAFGPHSTYGGELSESRLAELRAQRAARPSLTADTLEGAVANLVARWGRPCLSSGPFYDCMRESIGPTADGKFDLKAPAFASSAYMEDFWQTRFDQDFARVRCPVLFLPDEASMQDPGVQASMAWFTGLLPEPYITLIPHAEHAAVWLDYPEACAEAVLKFIGGGAARGSR